MKLFINDHRDKENLECLEADLLLRRHEDASVAMGGLCFISASELVSSIQASPSRIHGTLSSNIRETFLTHNRAGEAVCSRVARRLYEAVCPAI